MRLRDLSPEALAEVVSRFCLTHRISYRGLAQHAGLAESTVILIAQKKHKARPRTCERLEQVIPPDGRLLPGFARRDQVLRGYAIAQEQAELRHAFEQPAATIAGHWTYLTDEDAATSHIVASQPVPRRIREEAPWSAMADRIAVRLAECAAERDPRRSQPAEILMLAPGPAVQEQALLHSLGHYFSGPLAVLLLDASQASLRRAERSLASAWTTRIRIQSVVGSVLSLDAAQGLLPLERARLVTLLGDVLSELHMEEPLLSWLRLLPPGDLVLLEVLTTGAQPTLPEEATLEDLNLYRLRTFFARHLAPDGTLGPDELDVRLEAALDPMVPGTRALNARAVRRLPGREQRWRLPFARFYELPRLLDLLRHLCGLALVETFRNGWDARRHYLLLERVP
jgi:hypothetical protein